MNLKGLIGKFNGDEESIGKYVHKNTFRNVLKEKIRRGIVNLAVIASLLGGINNVKAQDLKNEKTRMEYIVNRMDDQDLKDLTKEQLLDIAVGVTIDSYDKIVAQTKSLISQGHFLRARLQLNWLMVITKEVKDKDLLKSLDGLYKDLKNVMTQVPVKEVNKIEHNYVSNSGDIVVSIQILKGERYLTITAGSGNSDWCRLAVNQEQLYLFSFFRVDLGFNPKIDTLPKTTKWTITTKEGHGFEKQGDLFVVTSYFRLLD